MISDAPIHAAGPLDSLQNKVVAFIATAKVAAVNGLTWREFGELLVALLRISIETLDTVAGMTGEEKRDAVVQAAAALFDALADRAVPLAAWPLWIVARPAVRSLVLALAAGAVEPLLRLVRSRP